MQIVIAGPGWSIEISHASISTIFTPASKIRVRSGDDDFITTAMTVRDGKIRIYNPAKLRADASSEQISQSGELWLEGPYIFEYFNDDGSIWMPPASEEWEDE